MTQEGYHFAWMWFVCLYAGKLQCQLILEHRRENSRYVHVGHADSSRGDSLQAAKGDSSSLHALMETVARYTL